MPAGKQNNISSLLDGLDKIPEGFVFDQDRGWQRFEKELHSGNARRKKTWLMVAALIPVFAIGYFFARPVDKPALTVTATKERIEKLPASEQIPFNQIIVSRKKEEPVMRKKLVVHTIRSMQAATTDSVKLVTVVDNNPIIEPVKETTPITTAVPLKQK